MKIGVLTHNYPRFRGDFSGRFVEALSEELVTQGHDVTVLAPWDAAYARTPSDHRVRAAALPLRPARRLASARLHAHDARRCGLARRDLSARAGHVRSRARVRSCAGRRSERPDVLHAHWALPNGFIGALAARRYRIPLVVSIPGSDATVAGQNPVFRRMARFAFDQAGLITANSTALRDVAVGRPGRRSGQVRPDRLRRRSERVPAPTQPAPPSCAPASASRRTPSSSSPWAAWSTRRALTGCSRRGVAGG